jgi:hypothetical protein
MAGLMDKYKTLLLHFILAETGITQNHKCTNVAWHSQHQQPCLFLSLLCNWTWYFCPVAVAYIATSVEVYPKVASGFSKVCLCLNVSQ